MIDEKLQQWYNKNIDTAGRTIYFGPWQDGETGIGTEDCQQPWEVNDWSIQNLIKGLYVLDKTNHDPINIMWFSYGGDWDAGMAAYDFIQNMGSYVTMTCYGRIRSMGTVLLQACDERVLSPHCLFMIHYGCAAEDTMHSKDFVERGKEEARTNVVMEDIYLGKIREKHPRYSRERLQHFMRYDKYLKPKEAIDIGLVDKLLPQ